MTRFTNGANVTERDFMSKNTGMQFKVKGKRAESLGALSNWLRDFEHDPLGVPRGIFWSLTIAVVLWGLIIWAFGGQWH
jgi:hypothetical protein